MSKLRDQLAAGEDCASGRTAAAGAAGSLYRWGRGVPGPQPRIKPVCA